jgi:uncharacterized protein (DUF1800 family)
MKKFEPKFGYRLTETANPPETPSVDCGAMPCSDLLTLAITALRKWDAACKAADACNANAVSDNYSEDEWERLSTEHESALDAAEKAKDEVLALIDSPNA